MTQRVVIKRACLRDLSYIMGNLRAIDQLEAHCQLADGVTATQLAAHSLSGRVYIAYLDDVPVLGFGSSSINVCTASIWALGTRRSRMVIPDVTAFILDHHVPWLIENGITSVEARSIESHVEAHRWMRSLGAEVLGEPFEFGKGGERFQLFRWTVAGYRSMCEQRRRPGHVRQPIRQ